MSLYEIIYLGTVSLIHCPLTLEVGNYAVILRTCVQPIYKHVVTISATATLLYMVGVSGPAVIMAYKSIHPWVLRHNALCTVSTTIITPLYRHHRYLWNVNKALNQLVHQTY